MSNAVPYSPAGEAANTELQPGENQTRPGSAAVADDAAAATDAASAARGGRPEPKQQHPREHAVPPDRLGAAGCLGRRASEQPEREAPGEAPEAADVPFDAASGAEDGMVHRHTQEAYTAKTAPCAGEDVEIAAESAAAALAADRDSALDTQCSEDAASLAGLHTSESTEEADAAQPACGPIERQPSELASEPPIPGQAPHAAARLVSSGDDAPASDGCPLSEPVALAEHDPASEDAAVPGRDPAAADPDNALGIASDQEEDTPAEHEPADTDAAAEDSDSAQPQVELSGCAGFAAGASDPPEPSAKAEAGAEHDEQAAQLPDTPPTRSAAAAATRLHDFPAPSAEVSDDPTNPHPDTGSSDSSVAAVGDADAADSGSMLLSKDVAPVEVGDAAVPGGLSSDAGSAEQLNAANPACRTGTECSAAAADGERSAAEGRADVDTEQEFKQQEGDAAVVLPEIRSAGLSLLFGPLSDVFAEAGSCSSASPDERLAKNDPFAGSTGIGDSTEQRVLSDTDSRAAAAANTAMLEPISEPSGGTGA